MGIIPEINGTYKEINGVFVLPEEIGMNQSFPETNNVFLNRLKKLGDYKFTQRKQTICYQEEACMPKEAYKLQIQNDRVTITSSGETGYAYALVTLFQLLAEGRGTVKNCIISDEPRFAYRGIMLDVCRHFFPVTEIKKIIEQMALVKMNCLHWHLSDDQGYRIESRRFPKLNEVSSWRMLAQQDPIVLKGLARKGDRYGGYYTWDEIHDIVSFARVRQIEIIPEISMPGHSSAILAAYPEYTCSGKQLRVRNTFGVHDRIFCAGNKEVYSFLFELLDEILELFPGKFIHLGGDEVPKSEWHDCPTCNKLMQEKSLKGYEYLQCYFTNRIIDHIKEKGKEAIVWNESACSGELDETAVIQYWMEMAPGASYVTPEIAKGRKFILSSMNQFYCDYSYAEVPLHATLMYEPEIKGTAVPEENVFGIEAPMWTEWTPEEEDIEKMIYPRMLAVAECGWTKKRNQQDFMCRAEEFLQEECMNILTPMPWKEATIYGQKALEMIAVKMVELGAKYGNMAQGEDPNEVGKAEAVTPETESDTPQIDMTVMIRAYITERMKAAYTQEDIDVVMGMIIEMMSQEAGTEENDE